MVGVVVGVAVAVAVAVVVVVAVAVAVVVAGGGEVIHLAVCLAVFTLGWALLHALKTARWLDDRPSMARPGQRSNAPAPTLPHRGGGDPTT